MKTPVITAVAEYDFTAGFACDMFKTNLGLNDGCYHQDCGGLILDSHLFTKTPEAGPNNEARAFGWMDNNKMTFYTKQCFPVQHCRETVLAVRASAAQFFSVNNPVPQAFLPRVRNIQADPRLANGLVFFLQPETGMMFGYTITNQAIHALYARLPYARNRSMCDWISECQSRACVPCKSGLCNYSSYNQRTFWEDPRFRVFKQTASQRDWINFRNYISWRCYCNDNRFEQCNWREYANFCKVNGPLTCENFPREHWISWISYQDWDEYTYYYDWLAWREQEAEFGRPVSSDISCSGGCSTRVYYTVPGQIGTCSKQGCTSCQQNVQVQDVPPEKECYAYQWGKVRCCCDFQGASFLSLIEVAQRGTCDPLTNFACLSIGIDRSHSTVRWYINNVEVYTHVGIGYRTAEQYRVRENGGYAEEIDVTRVVAGFGTGSILDGSLPSNYNRALTVTGTNTDVSNLVPLLCESNYYNIYASRFGELPPVVPNAAFAVLGKTAASTAPGVCATATQWRLFGQGAILRLQYLYVYSRTLPPIRPVYAPAKCYSCFGPAACKDKCKIASGSCGKNCFGGCCGANCDVPPCGDEDDDYPSEIVIAGQTAIVLQSAANFRTEDLKNCATDFNDISCLDAY